MQKRDKKIITVIIVFLVVLIIVNSTPGVVRSDNCFNYDKVPVFTGSEYVESVTIESYVDNHFCSKDVVIPKELHGIPVKEIGSYAFSGKGVTSVVIPDTVINIHQSAFENNNLTSITIPVNVVRIETNAFKDNPLQKIEVLGENTRFDDDWEDIGFPISVLTE